MMICFVYALINDGMKFMELKTNKVQDALEAVDALHQPSVSTCHECNKAWPCPTHLAIYPDPATDPVTPPLHAGIRVVVSEGMGNYATGLLLAIKNGMCLVRYDGSRDPAGEETQPYDIWVNPGALSPDKTDGEVATRGLLPGYEVIFATA